MQAYEVAHVVGMANGEAVLPTFTWLDTDRMIFQRYKRTGSKGGDFDNYLAAYNFEEQEWDFLEHLAQDHPCSKEGDDEVWFYNTSLLPNGALGYNIRCKPPFGSTRSLTHFLYAWENTKNVTEFLFDFDNIPHESGYPVSAYSLSPDMREIAYSVGRSF